jgi:hypothetical protein
MKNDLDCATVEDQLAEFAAGTLPADQRGAVEAHLNVCGSCRAEAESLIDTADAVLLFAPSAEPPAGFEARLLDRMQPPVRRLPRRRPVLIAVAAAVLVVIGVVAAVSLSIGRPDGNRIQEVALRTPDDKTVGAAYVRAGDPGWILVDMAYREDPSLSVQLVQSDGTVTVAGPLSVRNGHGILGFTSPVPVADLREVRMVEQDGTVVCDAAIRI